MALFLLVVLSFQQLYNLWNIAWFYTNRDYIAENLCINRSDPMTLCGGTCYLAEKLTDFQGSDANLTAARPFESPKIFEAALLFCFCTMLSMPETPGHFYSEKFAIAGFKERVLHPPITC